jgi:hypothetical protein
MSVAHGAVAATHIALLMSPGAHKFVPRYRESFVEYWYLVPAVFPESRDCVIDIRWLSSG